MITPRRFGAAGLLAITALALAGVGDPLPPPRRRRDEDIPDHLRELVRHLEGLGAGDDEVRRMLEIDARNRTLYGASAIRMLDGRPVECVPLNMLSEEERAAFLSTDEGTRRVQGLEEQFAAARDRWDAPASRNPIDDVRRAARQIYDRGLPPPSPPPPPEVAELLKTPRGLELALEAQLLAANPYRMHDGGPRHVEMDEKRKAKLARRAERAAKQAAGMKAKKTEGAGA